LSGRAGSTPPGPGKEPDRAGSPVGAAAAAAGAAASVARATAVARGAGVRIHRNEPLAGRTTMRVGGPADVFVEAKDVATMTALVRAARAASVAVTILGRGSNVIVADAGIRGLVILSRAEGCRIEGDRLIAEAGLPLARAATVAQRAGLSGLEFGLAIPGTVGGAIWGNAGAHGSDIAAVLESVTVLRSDGAEATEPVSALALKYRDSRIKRSQSGSVGDLILTATFRLNLSHPAAVKARLDEILRWRQEHQPLNKPSAGSVFRNPEGDSAGRLIDECGLKGRRVGGAAVSEKHANFIVNEGRATAADVRALGDLIRAEVASRFGVELVYEVRFIGDWPDLP
jgi:UDP-N-acetylmuramate dehydrogenase